MGSVGVHDVCIDWRMTQKCRMLCVPLEILGMQKGSKGDIET